jgi:hypothetical protein
VEILDRLRWKLHGIKHGIRNLIRWAPIAWDDEDWDWEYLARVMEFKLRRSSKSTKDWNTVGADRCGKEMLICAELIRRLREDDYIYSLPLGQSYKGCGWKWGKHIDSVSKNDRDLLFKIMRRKMMTWWD